MIRVLDLQFGRPHIIAAFLVETTQGPVLIETGPESCFPQLEDALRQYGYRASDLSDVLLTHIHLDHAGAAWRLAELGATLHVHPAGAPHLHDPSKLWASAARIYGDQMESLWGRARPVDPARVRLLDDGQVLKLGDVSIQVYHTPGHASHHVAFRLDHNLFAGDVAGVRIGRGPVVPPCPPPDIHVETWLATLERLQGLGCETLYLTHFGAFSDPHHFSHLSRRLLEWADWVRQGMQAGGTRESLQPAFTAYVMAQLEAAGLSAQEVDEFEKADPAWMSLWGLMRYWEKYHPNRIRSEHG